MSNDNSTDLTLFLYFRISCTNFINQHNNNMPLAKKKIGYFDSYQGKKNIT